MGDVERVLYSSEGRIMKAIICDDEKSTCSELEEVIRKYAQEKSVPFVTEVFYSGDTLLEYLTSALEIKWLKAGWETNSCSAARVIF